MSWLYLIYFLRKQIFYRHYHATQEDCRQRSQGESQGPGQGREEASQGPQDNCQRYVIGLTFAGSPTVYLRPLTERIQFWDSRMLKLAQKNEAYKLNIWQLPTFNSNPLSVVAKKTKPEKRTKRQKKDKNAPKKPMSAFFCYQQTRR